MFKYSSLSKFVIIEVPISFKSALEKLVLEEELTQNF